jgi:hypothetical protein
MENPHEKLDLVFDYFKRNANTNESEWQELGKKVGYHLNELVEKLRKDKFIEQREGRPQEQVTVDGWLFEGYVKSKRRANATKRLQITQTWVIGIGSLIAGLYAILQIIDWFNKCCSSHH